MINYIYFPKSKEIPENLKKIVTDVFIKNANLINSETNKLPSNGVLEILKPDLSTLGFKVEMGKTSDLKIQVPVLFGRNGQVEKSFDADAYNKNTKTVVEVEAGRGFTNYQFLKDLFQASVMVDVDYLVIAVRNIYRKSNDFEKVVMFFETLYSSTKLNLPLEGIIIIGY